MRALPTLAVLILLGACSEEPLAFEYVDQNGDGAISRAEARLVQGWLDFAAADANGDGTIDQTEYETVS